MPVTSSGALTIAAIAAEIGGQSAPHTLSTLAGLSTGTFDNGNNVAPHTMSEWAGYTHTTTFPTTETHARFGTTTGSWAVRVHTSHLASSAHAAGGVYIFQREISGDTVFQAEQVNTLEAGVSSQAHDEARFYPSSGSSSTFGSHITHSSPVSIITIPGVVGIKKLLPKF